jgi:hypothetical protein
LIIFGVLVLYFLIAPSASPTPVCGHDSCGADAAWSAMATAFAVLWVVLLSLARRRVASAVDTATLTTSAVADPDDGTAGVMQESVL